MSAIDSITARKVLDSRGQWTVEALLVLKGGASAGASVPQGKSTGSHEAVSLDPDEAVRTIESVIAPALRGLDAEDQEALDRKLIELDGTPNKSHLGANATLAVSVAALRASAREKKTFLWRQVRRVSKLDIDPKKTPHLFINVINGGLHAGSGLDFQEYMIIPRTGSILGDVDMGVVIYQELGRALSKKFGRGAALLGDEGGYAPACTNNLEPFVFLKSVSRDLGFDDRIEFGLDAAASTIKKDAGELEALYDEMVEKYHVRYIEDPFGENDFENFAEFTTRIGERATVIGDDLTVTNVGRMREAKAASCVRGVIIKPNQIGTVSEAFAAVRLAREYGWMVVASHRSGETNDDFIADFAFGVGADGLKLGAPARGERVAKYNRLLEIEKETKV